MTNPAREAAESDASEVLRWTDHLCKPIDDSAYEFSNKLVNVDTEYDWCPQFFANGNLKFAGRKPGAANMVLSMAQNAGTWDVSLFTTSNGKDRKTRGNKWRDGLSRIDAMRHCRDVIDELH